MWSCCPPGQVARGMVLRSVLRTMECYLVSAETSSYLPWTLWVTTLSPAFSSFTPLHFFALTLSFLSPIHFFVLFSWSLFIFIDSLSSHGCSGLFLVCRDTFQSSGVICSVASRSQRVWNFRSGSDGSRQQPSLQNPVPPLIVVQRPTGISQCARDL